MSYTPGLWITWCDESGYMPDTFRIHPSREEAEAVIRAANDATDGNVTMYMAPYSHLRTAPELVTAAKALCVAIRMAPTDRLPAGQDEDVAIRTQYFLNQVDALSALLARVKGE